MTESHLNFSSTAWSMTEDEFKPEFAGLNESLFSVANGYIGIRGAFDEAYAAKVVNSSASTFLNGVYESFPIEYEESAPGFAQNNHTLVQVPDGCFFELLVDDEKFCYQQGQKYYRCFSLADAVLSRTVEWESESGKRVAVTFTRFASAVNKELAIFHYEIKALNFSGKVKLISGMGLHEIESNKDDPRASQNNRDISPTVLKEQLSLNSASLTLGLPNSQIEIGVSISHQFSETAKVKEFASESGRVTQEICLELGEGVGEAVSKYLCYADSLRSNDILEEIETAIQSARAHTYEKHVQSHQLYWRKFWDLSDIKIKGCFADQVAVRFNILHLQQSTSFDDQASISAKGLSGSGYDGHIFWDAEIFVLPFFLYTQPERARQLLEYRKAHLQGARTRAREMSHAKGALYPWRTIGGEECSAYYPAGTAQYHINADIAFATHQYFNATNDIDFLLQGGAEMILETARVWPDMGGFTATKDGAFCIFGVTGPDEYTTMVNNNYYTNVMAKFHLTWALELVALLKEKHLTEWESLVKKIQITVAETTHWERIVDQFFIAPCNEQGLIPQDDSFLQKPIWDFANAPKEKYPLLLHYHPMVIYRHQVCKQADILLALLLQKADQKIMQDNFAYYEPLTTHDSTLSSCVHSIVASKINNQEKANAYFQEALWTDLSDLHSNSYYGIHSACMGGVWMAVISGFAGVEFFPGKVLLNPKIPASWQALSFKLNYQNSLISIDVNNDFCKVQLESGSPLTIIIDSNEHTLIDNLDIPRSNINVV